VRDTGLLPEGERARRAASRNLTIAEMAADRELYPLEKYLAASELALRAERNAQTTSALITLTGDKDSGLRYWGAYGLLLRAQGDPADKQLTEALKPLLSDSCPEVRATAAWALLPTKATAPQAREALRTVLKDDAAAALFALNVLDWSKEAATQYSDLLEALLESKDAVYGGYLKRMVTHLRATRAK
jgi:HEAT repeat protein